MQIYADSKGNVAAGKILAMIKGLHCGFDNSLKIHRLADPVPLTLDPIEPKINRLRQTIEDYYRAKFQFIPIRGFRFIVLTYTPPPYTIHTS